MQSLSGALANNVNDRFSLKTNNVNDNNDNVVTIVRKTEEEVDRMASYLMEKLGASDSYREWYCKVCWRLPENVVMMNLDKAIRKGSNPAKYFTWLSNKSMRGYNA